MSTPTIATLTVMRSETALLAQLLPTLSWADERHVVETGPDAGPTRKIAAGAHVHHHPLPAEASFEDARAAAFAAIRSTWVLVVDTDERLTPSLVRTLLRQAAEWESVDVSGVWLPRRNHVGRVALQYSSAWPDYQLRFFRLDRAQYIPTLHAPAQVAGTHIHLPASDDNAILHYAFRTTEQFVDKLNKYSSLEARQRGPASTPTPSKALLRALRDFAARYVKMRGYRDGAVGLHFSLVMSMYRYLSEVKRWELAESPETHHGGLEGTGERHHGVFPEAETPVLGPSAE